MHKIKKGIKKKIKGKKGKHEEDDLFDPEQLEKYRRELEEAKAAKAAAEGGESEDPTAAAGTSSSEGKEKKADDDEEWQKFKQLTSGIDQVLKKTSGDLDRIKTSSYFQRVPPKPDFIIPTSSTSAQSRKQAATSPPAKKGTRWIDLESGQQPSDSEDEGKAAKKQVPEEQKPAEEEEATEELEDKRPETPDVEPIELEDDLFDTSFVDAIASGEIKLAYIPDSPTEEDDGDDPFDTSAVADVVKKIEEEEKRKKRQVDLGLAVNVLSGKPTASSGTSNQRQGNKPALDTSRTKRARPRPTNLLDFDDNPEAQLALSPSSETTPKPSASQEPESLFDALLASSPPPPETEEVIPLVKAPLIPSGKEDKKPEKSQSSLNLDELLSEFDVIKEVPKVPELPLEVILNPVDDFEDEFAALAVESLHKDGPKSASPTPDRPPPPRPAPPAGAQTPVTPLVEDNEPDPFDTTFVEKLPIGKGELKLVEKEFLGDRPENKVDEDDFDFDPRAGEEPLAQPSNLVVQRDLLGGSATDLSSITAADPLAPESSGLIETEIHDPFDTSVAEQLLPGKAELKLLEQELLKTAGPPRPLPPQPPAAIASVIAATLAAAADDDFDFDPRKDEKVGSSPANKPPPHRPPPPKAPHPLDLPAEAITQEELCKTLTPVGIKFGENSIDRTEAEIDDPFDTSNVSDVIAPKKAELRLLESELVSSFSPVLPPSVGVNEKSINSSVVTSKVNVLDADDDDFNPRAGTDQVVPDVPVASLVETVVEPIFDSTFDIPTHDKLLTPVAATKAPSEEFEDPFDTSSFVSQTILPGKAELKFLEKELLETVEDVKPPSLPEVPLPPPKPVVPPPPKTPEPHLFDDLEPATVADVPLRPLTPSHLDQGLNFDDPFDTSIASTIVPGKTELKILEKELVSDPLHDPGFNPRDAAFPVVSVSSQPLIPVSVSQQPAAASAAVQQEEIDPFDTTAAENVVPGKAELKILEAELL